jgi:predicted nucleotide-binding protein (sugar kinase/HSP70/actin superfamily)
MNLSEYFKDVKGKGVLATSDSNGNVDIAIYSRPYIIDENKIAFSMLERLSYSNVQSNPKAAYLFI